MKAPCTYCEQAAMLCTCEPPPAPSPKLALIESPFAGDVERNTLYVRAAMRDAFMRGYYPFASHALYTLPGVLDDLNRAERVLGIEAGLAWGACAAETLVYADLGVSDGMLIGIERARKAGRPVLTVTLPRWSRP